MTIYLYIVKCADDSYYTGVTNNLERRIAEHNQGASPRSYTFLRRPVKLVYFESFSDPYMAFVREKQIKGWSRRKKIAMIEGNWVKVIEFSKRYNKNNLHHTP